MVPRSSILEKITVLFAVFIVLFQSFSIPIYAAVQPWKGSPWTGDSWEGNPWTGDP